MLGYIYLFDNNTNKVIKRYSDENLYKEDSNERFDLKSNFLDKYNDRFTLKCSCNKNIELSIDSLGRIYHKTQSDLVKHDKFCTRHKYFDKNFKKGWNEISKNKILVDLSFNIFNKENKNSKISSKIDSKKNSISLDEFIKHLNIKSFKHNLSSKYDILNQAYFLSEKIYINGIKNKTLRDFYFDIKSFNKITKFTPKFIYMYLNDIEELNDTHVKVKCEYLDDKFFNFICSKELLYKNYLAKNIKKVKHPIIISGFINKTSLGLEFYEVTLIKVNKDGIY